MILLTHFISFSVLSVQPQAELKAEDIKTLWGFVAFCRVRLTFAGFPNKPVSNFCKRS